MHSFSRSSYIFSQLKLSRYVLVVYSILNSSSSSTFKTLRKKQKKWKISKNRIQYNLDMRTEKNNLWTDFSYCPLYTCNICFEFCVLQKKEISCCYKRIKQYLVAKTSLFIWMRCYLCVSLCLPILELHVVSWFMKS